MACSREQQEFEGGYELKMVNEDKDLECSICIHLLKEAMGTPCSHVFCRGCILKLTGRKTIGGATFTCPDCQQQVDTDKVYPNTFLDRKVGGSNVYCLQRTEGCEWIGTLNSFQKHQSECDFQIVQCNYEGCLFSGIKLEIKDHESHCKYRTEKCEPGMHANLLQVLRKDFDEYIKDFELRNTQYQSKVKDLEAANREIRDEFNQSKRESQLQIQALQNEISQLKNANTKLQNEVQLLRRESSNPTLSEDIQHGTSSCSNKTDKIWQLTELLLNGAEKWIKRKETLNSEETEKYQSWYKRVFMLMKENEVYKFGNAMFVKLQNEERRAIYWSSNNEAEQEAVFKNYNECYVSKDGSMVGGDEAGIEWVVETKTLDYFMLSNSKVLCLNRFVAGKGYTKVLQQRGSFKGGWFAGKPRMNHGWSVKELSDDFYLNDSVIVCMIRT